VIDGLPICKCDYHGNRLHAKGGCQILLFVDIDFGEDKFSLIFLHQLIKQGRQLLAGATPGSPEVNDNGELF